MAKSSGSSAQICATCGKTTTKKGHLCTPVPIEDLTLDVELPSHTRFVSVSAPKSARPDLQTATRVVSGGRAIGSAEDFKVIYGLAAKRGAQRKRHAGTRVAGRDPNLKRPFDFLAHQDAPLKSFLSGWPSKPGPVSILSLAAPP